MKKNLFSRIARLTLSLCLILALSLTGVVLDNTGIFGANNVGGDGSSAANAKVVRVESGSTYSDLHSLLGWDQYSSSLQYETGDGSLRRKS